MLESALLVSCQAGSHASADRAAGATQAMLDAGFRLQKRACVADEHYVPTLLAVHGLDNQVITMAPLFLLVLQLGRVVW